MADRDTVQKLIQAFALHGDAPALVAVAGDTVATTSFSQMVGEIDAIANRLAGDGLGPGDAVAIYAAPGPAWITACFGILAAGAFAVTLDAGLDGDALAEQLKDGKCRAVFTTADLKAVLDACGGPDGLQIILPDGEGAPPPPGNLQPLPQIEPSDRALLIYTSGTTGRPKGVPLSHANLMANLDGIESSGILEAGDRMLLPLPLHHVYPLVVGALAPLAAGVAVVFPAGVSGPEIAGALRAGDVTVMVGVPKLYVALAGAIAAGISARGRFAAMVLGGIIRALELAPGGLGHLVGGFIFRSLRGRLGPGLRMMLSGGAALDPAIWRRLEVLGWQVLTGYGLTETAPILTFNRPGQRRIGTTGQALLGVELRIEGTGQGDDGEIQARGPNVFSGYHHRPAETKSAFTGDGWFRTGDVGYLDGEGCLHIEGRVNEMIVLADGKNIFPEPLEAVYGESRFVEEIAVLEHEGMLVALVSPDLEAVRAYGTASPETLIRDALIELSMGRPTHERLSGVELVREGLPRTALGKLRRHLLAGLYAEVKGGTPRRQAAAPLVDDQGLLSRPAAAELWRWLQIRFPDDALDLETSPQLDLGVDSLAWAGLSLEMEEHLGVRLDEERLSRVLTLRDLLREAVDTPADSTASATTGAPTPAIEPVPASAPQPASWLVVALLYVAMALTMRLWLRLRVTGLDQLPETGPFVITPNHASWLDPVAVAASLPFKTLRRTYFAGAKATMFGGPVARAFSRAAQVFPVDADRATGSSLARARQVLAQGDLLVWFAEGGRTLSGEVEPFMPGIGGLLVDAGVAAVPVHISGTFESAPRGRVWPRRVAVTVTFSGAIDAAALARQGEGGREEQRIASALRQAVIALGSRIGD